MAEDNQLAVVRGQCSDDSFNLDGSFAPFAFLFGRQVCALDWQIESVAFRPGDEGLFASGGATEMIDRGVVSDLVEPGRKLELGAVTVEGVVDLDEDFLREVERSEERRVGQ